MAALLLVAFCGVAQADERFNGQWIDLTHSFSEGTLYWPTAERFKKTTVFHGHTEKGYFYTAYNFSAAEHGGTHLDAPIHFYDDRQTVDEIPVEQLIGPAVVIRVAKQVEVNRNYQLAVSDIQAWERKHGPLSAGSIVLVDTGMSRYWPNAKDYMGTDERGEGGVKKLKFPGIHPDAARYLVAKNIKALGLDSPSIDFGGSSTYETHQVLFEHNIPGFENVAHLNRLPEVGATVIALPMKIQGGSGAPLRIVAFVPAE